MIFLNKKKYYVYAIVVSTIAITYLHYSTSLEEHALHSIYAELYYIPILIAAFLGYVAIIDSFLILGMYFITATSWRNVFWLRKMNKKHILVTIIVGTIIAAIIEYERVFISKVWSYNALMPTLFGIGLSPLFQLSVTGLITFSLTRAILYQRGIYSERIPKE